jgi:hypothetical protein
MYTAIKHLHSGFRYFVLMLLFTAITAAFIGWLGNKKYLEGNRKVNLFAMIAVHIQILGGLILYFVSDFTKAAFANWGAAMKDTTLRYWALEHVVMMLLAMVIITIGHSKAKKANNDILKHRTIAIYYTLALIVIVAAILQSGRPLLGFQ